MLAPNKRTSPLAWMCARHRSMNKYHLSWLLSLGVILYGGFAFVSPVSATVASSPLAHTLSVTAAANSSGSSIISFVQFLVDGNNQSPQVTTNPHRTAW